jgi:hypothetical protein
VNRVYRIVDLGFSAAHRSTRDQEAALVLCLPELGHRTGSGHGSSPQCEEEEEGTEDVLTTDLFGCRSDGIQSVVEFNGGDILSSAGRGSRHRGEELIAGKC